MTLPAVGDEKYLVGNANADGSIRVLVVADSNGDGLPDGKLQWRYDGRWLDLANVSPIPAASVVRTDGLTAQQVFDSLAGGGAGGGAASTVTNDSGVAGGTVKAALDALAAVDVTKADATATTAALAGKLASALLGTASGVAQLDSGGRLPSAQLPSGVAGGLHYKGTWNATTNTPSLASGVGTDGDYYVVSTAGSTTLDTISSWAIGDQVLFSTSAGGKWQKVGAGQAITSVYGRTTAAIVATAGDYNTDLITRTKTRTNFTPSAATAEGDIAGIDTKLGALSTGGLTSAVSTATQAAAPATSLTTTQAQIGNTVTITPKSTASKIHLVARLDLSKDATVTARTVTVRAWRGAVTTGVQVGQDAIVSSITTSGKFQCVAFEIDAPATTSATSYRISAACDTGAVVTVARYEFQAAELLQGGYDQTTPVDWTGGATGAVARTATAKAGEVVSVKDFGAAGDGTTNDSAAFAAALAAASYVYVPPGTYLLNTSVTLAGYKRLFGAGGGTILRPGMTDGSGCISVAGGTSHWGVENLRIETTIDFNSFVAGSVNGQNCVGIKAGTPNSSYASRYTIRNVRVYGCKTGFDITGFSAETPAECFADSCETGLIGNNLNAVIMEIQTENCRKPWAITNSRGLSLGLFEEGGNLAATVSAAAIDDCHGLAITRLYCEADANRGVPHLIIGGTTLCTGVTIDGMEMTSAGPTDYGVAPLKLDRVDRVRIRGHITTGPILRSVETTANTKGLRWEAVVGASSVNGGGCVQDASLSLRRPCNLFPNPQFDVWFRGWKSVLAGRTTLAKETTLVRTGANALRVTPTTGTASNYVAWTNATQLVTALRGKTATMFAWVWVPNVAAYNEASRTMNVGTQLESDNGSVSVDSADNGSSTVRNAWNLMRCTVPVQSDATTLTVWVFANNSGTNASGAEYVVVDSIYLFEGDISEDQFLAGGFGDSPLIDATFRAGMMTAAGTTFPTDTAQTYGQGDKVWATNVAAAGVPGWVCTTAGVGGTAVWKAMGAVAA